MDRWWIWLVAFGAVALFFMETTKKTRLAIAAPQMPGPIGTVLNVEAGQFEAL